MDGVKWRPCEENMDAVLTVITRGKHGQSVNGDHERKTWTQC